MNIKTAISTWILARLMDEEYPISRKNLLKQLCQASFASMTRDDEYGETIEELKKAGYIEFKQANVTRFIPINDGLGLSFSNQKRLERVNEPREGYEITEDGIREFRKQIVTTIDHIRPEIERVSKNNIKKFETIIETIRRTSNLMESVTKLCIDNAPLVLDFINTVRSELVKLGINIPYS
jgi:hypothetical protein